MDMLIACMVFVVAMFFISVGIQVLTADRVAYRSCQALTKNVKKPVLGMISTYGEGSRDYRVAAGMLWDRKSKRVIDQGKLSNESIDSLFR